MAHLVLQTTAFVSTLLLTFLPSAEPQAVLDDVEVPHEKQIINKLLNRYEKRGIDGRPVLNSSKAVNIYFGIQLIQIIDLDEKNQVLMLNVWDRYSWMDEFLTWNASEYGNVEDVRITQDKIWKPDIKLYNYADERTEEHREALTVVYSTGKIIWMPQAIYKSSCHIDITRFPFDEQECKLKFGSWTYNGLKLDVKFLNDIEKIDLSEFIKSNEWEIIEAPAVRNIQRYTCCPEPYIDLTFILRVRRRSAFYKYLLLLPCILLSTLTLVLFWIPPESPAKMALGMNIFVAFFLLLVILEGSLPSASSVPLLGIYYCFNMIMITLSSFLNVLVVNMAFYGNRGEVPQILRTVVFSGIAKIFCMSRLADNARTDRKEPHKVLNGSRYMGVNAESNWAADAWKEPTETSEGTKLAEIVSNKSSEMAQMMRDLKDIRQYLYQSIDREMVREQKEMGAKEWKAVALIMDRLFFYFYLVMVITSLIVVPSIGLRKS